MNLYFACFIDSERSGGLTDCMDQSGGFDLLLVNGCRGDSASISSILLTNTSQMQPRGQSQAKPSQAAEQWDVSLGAFPKRCKTGTSHNVHDVIECRE